MNRLPFAISAASTLGLFVVGLALAAPDTAREVSPEIAVVAERDVLAESEGNAPWRRVSICG
jgi:hypothetical protein